MINAEPNYFSILWQLHIGHIGWLYSILNSSFGIVLSFFLNKFYPSYLEPLDIRSASTSLPIHYQSIIFFYQDEPFDGTPIPLGFTTTIRPPGGGQAIESSHRFLSGRNLVVPASSSLQETNILFFFFLKFENILQ